MAFAVGLGAVVMQFSEGLIGGEEKTACGADFQLVVTNICMRTAKSFEFTAANKGDVNIDGLRVLIEDSSGDESSKKFMSPISEEKSMSQKINYNGKLEAVQFIPLIKKGVAKDSGINACSIRAITFTKNKIKSC